MRTAPYGLAQPPPRRPQTGLRGFTMVEVALALGVIAIALVAIIGVMPTGLQVQRENREDTILNQDGLIWIEALRNGRDVADRQKPLDSVSADSTNGFDYLLDHVVAVTITNAVDGAQLFVNPSLVRQGGPPLRPFGRLRTAVVPRYILTNGWHIVGLLSRPYTELRNDIPVTNYVAALVRSISGPATDRGSVGRDLALTYVLTSQLTPLGNYPASWVNYQQPGLSPDDVLVRSNRFVQALNQGGNFMQLSLSLAGPAMETARDGQPRWEVFREPMLMRTILSGRHFSYDVMGDPSFVVSYVLPGGFRRLTP